jgi:uncharacterized protein YigA (DUF484 family)
MNSGGKFLDRVRGKPPAEQLQATGDLLAKRVEINEAVIERTRGQIEELRKEIKGDLAGIAKDNEERSSKLHRRVDDVLRAVSELRGELNRIGGV